MSRSSGERIAAVLVEEGPEGALVARHRDIAAPVPARHEALVRPEYVGICGSDLEQLGRRPVDVPNVRVPHVLGHEWSGVVVRPPADRTTLAEGDRVVGHGVLGAGRWFGVTDDGAMAERFRVPADVLFTVPEDLDAASAAVLEPFVCASAAMLKAGVPQPGEVVHVHGLGAIGLCAVIRAVMAGASVTGYDPSPQRRDLALSLGADAAVDPATVDVEEVAAGPGAARLVVEASGVAAAQAAALESAAVDGRVVFMGVSHPRPAPARLGLVQQRNLSVMASTGAPPDVWPQCRDLARSRHLDLKALVSAVFPFSRIEEAVDAAASPGVHTKVLCRPDTADE